MVMERKWATRASMKQAKEDATALLLAKLLQHTQVDDSFLEQTMGMLMDDPEKMAGACNCLLNLIVEYTTQSGHKPWGLQELVDHMIKELGIAPSNPMFN